MNQFFWKKKFQAIKKKYTHTHTHTYIKSIFHSILNRYFISQCSIWMQNGAFQVANHHMRWVCQRKFLSKNINININVEMWFLSAFYLNFSFVHIFDNHQSSGYLWVDVGIFFIDNKIQNVKPNLRPDLFCLCSILMHVCFFSFVFSCHHHFSLFAFLFHFKI